MVDACWVQLQELKAAQGVDFVDRAALGHGCALRSFHGWRPGGDAGSGTGRDPRMVNARTYLLWRDLAMSENLPTEALKTVVEALCAPAISPPGIAPRPTGGGRKPSKLPSPRCWPGPLPSGCGAGSWCRPTRRCWPPWRPTTR